MELVKLTNKSRDNPQILHLAKLKQQMYIQEYPILPPPDTEFLILQLIASERPTYTQVYYLLMENSDEIGFVQVVFNKLHNKNIVSFISFITDLNYQSLLNQALLKLVQQLPNEITLIEIAKVEAKLGPQPIHYLSFYDQLNSYLVYQERLNVSKFERFNVDEIETQVTQLLQQASDKGYSIEIVKQGKFEEHDSIDYSQLVTMVEAIRNDMPIEDASWEDERLTPEIYNALFKNIRELAGHHWSVVALDNNNNAVGLSDIYFYPGHPKVVMQGDTGVIRSHRGNRLGKTLKYYLLYKILTELDIFTPEIWITGNANSNEHMIAINDELGYEHWYSEYYYEIPKDTFLKLLS